MKKQKNFRDQEKLVNKKKFRQYFSYVPVALVNKLLSENTQDLRKSLDEIKQQKIKLNEGERNSTNNKNENERLNNIQIAINGIDNLLSVTFFWVNNRMN